jgi:hypothetical protein
VTLFSEEKSSVDAAVARSMQRHSAQRSPRRAFVVAASSTVPKARAPLFTHGSSGL